MVKDAMESIYNVQQVYFVVVIQEVLWTIGKVMGTRIYLEITVTRFMQPMPILTPPSTMSVLGS